MENELKITVDKDVKELVIREGSAINIDEEKKVVINGNIYSVREFLLKYYTNSKIPGYIKVEEQDNGNASISYYSNPAFDKSGYNVSGNLTINPDIAKFNVNGSCTFSNKQIIGLARKYAHWFENYDLVKKLIKELENFEFKIEVINKEEDDRKGNKEKAITEQLKVAKGMMPESLSLKIPVFPGHTLECKFEIEMERNGNSVLYGFYSIGFEQSIKELSEKIITEQLTEFRDDVIIIFK